MYIVSEALGSDLYNAVVRKKRKLTMRELQTILKDIVRCMVYLKKEGIIHCDLKPENILIKNEGSMNVKVIDFGSACFIGNQDYDYLQTRPYRAPEISFGCQFDFAADMWSLGCIVYELLTCKVLFNYKTVQENFAKALAINNSVDFRMFSDGKKGKAYLTSNGLLSVPSSRAENQPPSQVSYIVIPRDGVDFRAELAGVCPLPELADFIRQCLLLEPGKRLKIDDALEHPFLKLKLK